MRLKPVVRYLEDRALHEPLLRWFKEAHRNVRGKIVSLHFVRELHLEDWKDPSFGYRFSEAFSDFLSGKGTYEAVEIARAFCLSNTGLRFEGTRSAEVGLVAHIEQLPYAMQKVKGLSLAYDASSPPEDMVRDLSHALKGRKMTIGHQGIAWFAPYEDGLHATGDSKTACDLLGMDVDPDLIYVVLTIPHDARLCRPTVVDGKLTFPFRPDSVDSGWGRTLCRSSLSLGSREAVMQESEHHAELRKDLTPSPDGLSAPSDALLDDYLDSELESLRNDDYYVYQDLRNAWT